MTQPAAGWYPDPSGARSYRYWNGHAWTDHVSPPVPAAEPADLQQPPMSPPDASGRPIGEPAQPPAAPLAANAPAGTVPQPPAAVGGAPSAPAGGYPPTAPPGAGWSPAAAGMAPVGSKTVERRGPDGQILAGWWRRFLGYLLDYLMIALIAGLFVAIVGSLTGGFGDVFDAQVWQQLQDRIGANPGYQPTEAEVLALFGPDFFTLLSWLFAVRIVLGLLNGVLLVSLTGQTVADRLVRTRKVLAGRRVPGFGWALLRWLLPEALVLLMGMPLLGLAALGAWILNYLWPLWDPQRQAWHDKAAKTFVERSDLAGAPNS